MAGCFFSETDIGSSDDDCLAGVVVGRRWERGEELGVDEAHGDDLLWVFRW